MKDYFKWLLFKHKFGKIKFMLMLLGVLQCIIFTDDLYSEYLYGGLPLLVLYLCYIPLYGFPILMVLQPYAIYHRLDD